VVLRHDGTEEDKGTNPDVNIGSVAAWGGGANLDPASDAPVPTPRGTNKVGSHFIFIPTRPDSS
jgi:hypothetical protein